MPAITIVTPAFNVEKYIGEAIESVISQTFTDWEMIIVDDASTDNTRSIIESYVKKDSRIKCECLSQNSGAARIPRLHAVSIAKGDWILCLDSDDTLEKTCLRKLYDRALETKADIVLQKMLLVDGQTIIKEIPTKGFNINQIITGKEAFELTIGGWKIGANGLYKSTIFKRRLDDFSDNYINSDEIDTRKMFLEAYSIAFCNSNYYYRICQSITRRFSLKRFECLKTILQLRDIVLDNFPADCNVVDKIHIECLNTLVSSRFLYLQNRHNVSVIDKKLIDGDFKKVYSIVSNEKKINISFFRKVLFLYGGYRLFSLNTFLIYLLKK